MYFEVLKLFDEYSALLGIVLLWKIVCMVKSWFTYRVVMIIIMLNEGTMQISTLSCTQVTFLEFVRVISKLSCG